MAASRLERYNILTRSLFLGPGKGADYIPGYLAGGSGGGHGGRGGRAIARVFSGASYGSVLKPLDFG